MIGCQPNSASVAGDYRLQMTPELEASLVKYDKFYKQFKANNPTDPSGYPEPATLRAGMAMSRISLKPDKTFTLGLSLVGQTLNLAGTYRLSGQNVVLTVTSDGGKTVEPSSRELPYDPSTKSLDLSVTPMRLTFKRA
jgi:hypothetical protein